MADSQLRKGVLELVVLLSLEREPASGGALLARLKGEGLDVSSGTVYPLLTRLRKAGYIDARWEESPVGPPRKVYDVTDDGRAAIARMTREWRSLAAIVDAQLEGR